MNSFVPENEMGVIVRFAQEASVQGITIKSIRSQFPDAIIEWEGQTYRVEFEYLSSNFIHHGHDCRECDILICWQHDLLDFVLPVIALEEEGCWDTPLTLATTHSKEVEYWRLRALRAEYKYDRISFARNKSVIIPKKNQEEDPPAFSLQEYGIEQSIPGAASKLDDYIALCSSLNDVGRVLMGHDIGDRHKRPSGQSIKSFIIPVLEWRADNLNCPRARKLLRRTS